MTSSGTIVKFMDNGRDHPFVVYMVLNKINGNFYIGATEKGTKRRGWVHKTNANRNEKNQYLYQAMRKYGLDCFKFLTIKECKDYWDALEGERAYIALLKPVYNLTSGGGGVKGHRHSEESKQKMSLAKKGKPGRKMTEAMRLHLSQKKSGVKMGPANGTNLEKIIANARLGNQARRRPIICLTDGKRYESLTEAGRQYGLTTGQITYHCTGNHRSRRGLKFCYAEKNNDE